MGDWREDRFLGEFLGANPNGGVETTLKDSEDGLEDCTDFSEFSAADDDALVSYLSGEIGPSTEAINSHSQIRKESTLPVRVPLAQDSSHVELDAVELVADGSGDCEDLCHSIADDDDGLSNHSAESETAGSTTVKKTAKDIKSLSSDNRLLPKTSQRNPGCVKLKSKLTDSSLDTSYESEEPNSSNSSASVQSEKPCSTGTNVTEKNNRGHSNSKQAIASRQRRQKNKQFLEDLKESVKKLSAENEQLKEQDAEKTRQIEKLQEENKLLKHLIAKKPTLLSIHTNVRTGNGVKLQASLPHTVAEQNENYEKANTNLPSSKKRKLPDKVLHLDKGSYIVTGSPKRPCVSKVQEKDPNGH